VSVREIENCTLGLNPKIVRERQVFSSKEATLTAGVTEFNPRIDETHINATMCLEGLAYSI